MPPKMKKVSQYTEEELLNFSREEMIDGMTDREVAFSEYYINDFNIKMAAIKAGYKTMSNKTISKLVRNKQCVIDYIAWLKVRLYHKAAISAEDILNGYAKMAFYDITDYIEKRGNKIVLKDFDKIDGQIIQEITQNASGGITIKFPDRLKAYDKLENYMDNNPYDWKRRMEEQKLEIMKERINIEKSKAGLINEIEDDGFLDALEKAASLMNENDIEEGNVENRA